MQSHPLDAGGEKLEFIRQRGSVGSMEQSLLAGLDFVPCGLAATQQRAPVLTNFPNHVQTLLAYFVFDK